MMKLVIVAFSLLSASSAFSAENRCKTPVEKQNPNLASMSAAALESKSNVIDQIAQGETDLSRAEAAMVLRTLKRPGTLAFSFSNDAGVWLSVASSSNCKVLMTIKILDI